MFTKVDILEATHRGVDQGRHYVIYFDGHSDENFLGGMITHSELYGNVKMNEDHFEKQNGNGENYKVTYDNSYLVKAKLMKPEVWGPFTKVGRLTENGKVFLHAVLEELESESFENYLKRNGLL